MTRRITGRPVVMLIAVAVAVLASTPALAASPLPSTGPAGGDPRSSGEGPGLMGDPLTAIVVVLAIGLASAAVTYLYVRLTAGPTRP